MALQAIDGRQHVYRVYAPENAPPAGLFRETLALARREPLPTRVGPVRRGAIRQVHQAPSRPGIPF